MSTSEIYNYLKVDDQVITAGQPTADQLRSAAAEGFITVINLAVNEPDRALEDEAGLVHSLGMAYYHIPVEWEHPTEADFASFEHLMEQIPAGKTLIHCAANYRVTAFYSLYAQKHLGWSAAQADTFRATIWRDSHYPAWERLIAQIKAQLTR